MMSLPPPIPSSSRQLQNSRKEDEEEAAAKDVHVPVIEESDDDVALTVNLSLDAVDRSPEKVLKLHVNNFLYLDAFDNPSG